MKLWSLCQGQFLASLEHTAALTALRLSNLLLCSACSDGGVYLWSIGSSPHSSSLPLMQWAIEEGVSFSCLVVDGGRLFTAGRLATPPPHTHTLAHNSPPGPSHPSDCVIYEWDIATGTCVRALRGHSKPVTSIWVRLYCSLDNNKVNIDLSVGGQPQDSNGWERPDSVCLVLQTGPCQGQSVRGRHQS